ncbi:MAG: sialate O-acetylesterase [Pseudomonadota bacterium]|nr:sialate O-acetylesterase [Pseudomonadota bacterium]
MQLFLLAGQSNMAGRGDVAPEDKLVPPGIFALNRQLEWVPAADPLHFDKPVAGVGPGLSFARAIAAQNGEAVIGLIPAAVGGSPITAWEPGALYPETGTRPYDDALLRTRHALRHGELRAILWHQGESDANPRAAPLYEARLRTLIERFRSEFGDARAPFLIGGLGQWPERPWDDAWKRVDQAHRDVAASMPGVRFVSSQGLAHKGDVLHFDASAARELGRRYAAAYLAITAGSPPAQENR